MDLEAWSRREPVSELGIFLGGVVVDHQVDVERGRHIGVDVPSESP
jgi:hypothetical protein